MRSFVTRVFLFLTPVIAIFIILEILTRHLPDDSYRIAKNYIDNNKDSIEMIILGTSHNTSGVNPNLINVKSVNLANGSQPLEYDYFFVEKYVKELPNLKYIVLEYSFHSLYYNPVNTNSWRAYYYYKYFDCDLNVNRFSVKKISDFMIHPKRNFARLYDHYVINGTQVSKRDNTKGWELMDGNFNDKSYDEVLESGERKYQNYWNNFFVEAHKELNIKHLTNIFSLCKEHQLKLIVVTPPAFESYSKHISQDKYQVMQSVIQNFQTMYQFEYYNFLYDPRFKLEDYYNHNHLNGPGSTKYSVLINDIVSNNQESSGN